MGRKKNQRPAGRWRVALAHELRPEALEIGGERPPAFPPRAPSQASSARGARRDFAAGVVDAAALRRDESACVSVASRQKACLAVWPASRRRCPREGPRARRISRTRYPPGRGSPGSSVVIRAMRRGRFWPILRVAVEAAAGPREEPSSPRDRVTHEPTPFSASQADTGPSRGVPCRIASSSLPAPASIS